MEKILAFLQEAKTFFVATVEDGEKKALEIMPALAQMIQPGKFEIFAITDGKAVISDLLSAETEIIEL